MQKRQHVRKVSRAFGSSDVGLGAGEIGPLHPSACPEGGQVARSLGGWLRAAVGRPLWP